MTAAPQSPLEDQNVSRRPVSDVDQALAHIQGALRGLQYGEISIVVQDGVVIQIERTERTRMRRRASK